MKKRVLAFDLGASSGRLIEGAFDGERLTLRELHRFPNEPVRLGATLYWDFPRLMHEIKIGLVRAGRGYDSMGVDTWGADAGFLDRTGNLLTLPVHYRDARYHGIREEVAAVVPPEELYARTGIQSLDFNTLNQLYYAKTRTPGLLEQARQLGAQCLVTADVKHDQFLQAAHMGMGLVDAGHFSTEQVVCAPLARWIQELVPQTWVARCSGEPFHWAK